MNIHYSGNPEPSPMPSADAGRFLEKGSLFDEPRQFRLGCTFDQKEIDLAGLAVHRLLGRSGVGWWECELAENQLTWTTGVYEIFGLPRASAVTRADAVSLYCEGSRVIMERLRSTAIKQDCGFMVDVEIRPANRVRPQWMRIVGVPVFEGGAMVRLNGLKLTV